MIKHHFREFTKSFGSQIDPEKSEELKRTKTDIENNLTRILKLIQNEEQSKRDGNSRKETELVGLIEDFYNQYQSLYALYGRLTGEYVKVVPRSVERLCSVSSSSSSESGYFSSEEVVSDTTKQELELVNNTTEVNDLNQKLFSTERECSSNLANNTNEVAKTPAPLNNEVNEFEERLNSQMKEVESLSQQKRNLELRVESQAREVKQLGAKNTELELLLKETKGAVSVLKAKLKSNDDKAISKNAELMAQINKLEQDAKSLRNQKGKMEEKLKRNRNEALARKKDLTDQLNVMQEKYDSVCKHNKELEAQFEREREQVSQCLVQMKMLKENLDETTSVEHGLIKEKECFLSRINDLELEMETRCSNQHDLEEQVRSAIREISRLVDERKALQDEKYELERAETQRKEDISAILSKHESDKNEASTHAMALTEEVENMRVELNTLQEQKSMLELQNEQRQNEYSESLAKMENLNVKLETKEETIKKLTETIDQMSAENKEAKIWSKMNQRLTERKMEELAEKLKKKIEDNIRLLHQRIHIAEQLNIENKARCKKTKQRYEQENKMLQGKIACYENELRTLKMSDLDELDLAARKVEEHIDYVLSLVSKMLCEVQFAKDWIKQKNGEMKQLKDKVDQLTALLSDKEEQELLLREKLWELEASVSKEGGEKLNLMKVVSQLEKKVGKLEKNLKEKDEELVGLGEKKREAIRQLCFLVEFHRERCDYLKGLITKTRISNRTCLEHDFKLRP